MDQIQSMRVVLQMAMLGSISAAARATSLSPTMATRHLDAVERKLGIQIFQRSTRRLAITGPGQAYIEFAQHILAEMESGEAALASQAIEAEGLLRLSAPLSFGIRYIAPLMGDFMRLHPNVRVELGLNDRVVDLIGEGWDLSVRIGRLRDNDLIARKFARYEMVICASPEYLARRGVPVVPGDLGGHDCLGYTLADHTGPRRWILGGRQGRVPVSGPFHANNGDVLVAAAVAGLGIIYQPSFIVADAVRTGALVRIGHDWPLFEVGGIYTVYPATRSMPSKMRAMIDFLSNAFSGQSPWSLPEAATPAQVATT